MRIAIACAAALAAFIAAADAQTPAPAIKRALMQRFDIAADREVILGVAEIPPGLAAGRHTHYGIETGYVAEGSATLEIEGEPPRVMKAGDSYMIPAGKIHDAKTLGDKPVRVVATYIVDKGKPLATPAP